MSHVYSLMEIFSMVLMDCDNQNIESKENNKLTENDKHKKDFAVFLRLIENNSIDEYDIEIVNNPSFLKELFLSRNEGLEVALVRATVKCTIEIIFDRQMITDVLKLECDSLKERILVQKRRCDILLARTDISRIKMNWWQTNFNNDSHTRDDLRIFFLAQTSNFETFAFDAISCVKELGVPEKECADDLVNLVIIPIYQATESYVDDMLKLRKDDLLNKFNMVIDENYTQDITAEFFWYSIIRKKVLEDIKNDIETNNLANKLLQEMTDAPQIHNQMIEAGEHGRIAEGEGYIRIPDLIKFFVEFFSIYRLSDQSYFLDESPGEVVLYREEWHVEILSPGTKKYGRIKQGDKVQVIFPGLYFESPNISKPILRSMVRRLV